MKKILFLLLITSALSAQNIILTSDSINNVGVFSDSMASFGLTGIEIFDAIKKTASEHFNDENCKIKYEKPGESLIIKGHRLFYYEKNSGLGTKYEQPTRLWFTMEFFIKNGSCIYKIDQMRFEELYSRTSDSTPETFYPQDLMGKKKKKSDEANRISLIAGINNSSDYIVRLFSSGIAEAKLR